MTIQTLEKEALKLSPEERIQLVDLLWTSLDRSYQIHINQAWAEESEERIKAFEQGKIEAIDGPSALDQIRKELIQ